MGGWWICCSCRFEIGSCSVAHAILELAIFYLSLPGAGVIGVPTHTQWVDNFNVKERPLTGVPELELQQDHLVFFCKGFTRLFFYLTQEIEAEGNLTLPVLAPCGLPQHRLHKTTCAQLLQHFLTVQRYLGVHCRHSIPLSPFTCLKIDSLLQYSCWWSGIGLRENSFLIVRLCFPRMH